ncbi:response regulator [Bradyrhizobium sp. CNPSo 4026]|nr:response regulator [Bradyrhizobium cenepequi]
MTSTENSDGTPPPRRRRHFLADDIARACRALGAEIEGPVGEVEDALVILNGLRAVDGTVLDLNLRSASIFPVARALQSRGTPFVFATGYDRTAIEPEFEGIPLWEKPLDIEAMTRELCGLMARPLTMRV